LSPPMWLFQTKTAKEQPACRLFYRSPNRRQPRISAVDEISMADSLPDEQQKQREARCSMTSSAGDQHDDGRIGAREMHRIARVSARSAPRLDLCAARPGADRRTAPSRLRHPMRLTLANSMSSGASTGDRSSAKCARSSMTPRITTSPLASRSSLTPKISEMHCEECAQQRAGRLPGSSPIHIVTDTWRDEHSTNRGLGNSPRDVDVTDDAPIYIPSFGHGELYG
jgi:hypothetical protein